MGGLLLDRDVLRLGLRREGTEDGALKEGAEEALLGEEALVFQAEGVALVADLVLLSLEGVDLALQLVDVLTLTGTRMLRGSLGQPEGREEHEKGTTRNKTNEALGNETEGGRDGARTEANGETTRRKKY